MFVSRTLALLSLLIVLSVPAAAHQPYFKPGETCSPAAGAYAEMKILYGDGIFAADPARVVLLDARGHLLAYSGNGFHFAIDSTTSGDCRAFDLGRRRVLTPEPAAFQPGPSLFDEDNVQARGNVLDATRWHGFSVRRSTLLEHLRATVIYAAIDLRRWAVFAGAGFFATLVLWIGVQRSSRRGWTGLAVRTLRLGFVLVASAVLAGAALGFLFIHGGPIDLLVAAGALGAVVMAGAIRGVRRLTGRV